MIHGKSLLLVIHLNPQNAQKQDLSGNIPVQFFFVKYLNIRKVSRAYLDFFLGKLTEYKRGKKPTRSEYVQTMTNESKREKNSRFFVLFLKIGIQDAKSPALLAYAMRKN